MSLQINGMGLNRVAHSEKDIVPVIGLEGNNCRFAPIHKSDDYHFAGTSPAAVVIDRPDILDSADLGIRHHLLQYDRDVFVKKMIAAFREHPHINNVLTHICRSQWTRIEQALAAIVNPETTQADLSPLAQNLVELMWAERGVTGRIFKPYLHQFLARALPHDAADWLLCHIDHLCPVRE